MLLELGNRRLGGGQCRVFFLRVEEAVAIAVTQFAKQFLDDLAHVQPILLQQAIGQQVAQVVHGQHEHVDLLLRVGGGPPDVDVQGQFLHQQVVHAGLCWHLLKQLGLLAGQGQHHFVRLVILLQQHELPQYRLYPCLHKGQQLVGAHLVGVGGQQVHPANRLVQVAVGLYRGLAEGTGDIIEVQIQAVLLLIARTGDIGRVLHDDILLRVLHHGHGGRHIAGQAADVHLFVAGDKVPLVQGELHVIAALVGDLVDLGLRVLGDAGDPLGVGLVRLQNAAAHHEWPLAVEIHIANRHRLTEHVNRAQRVEHHVHAVNLDDVLMHPHNGEVLDGLALLFGVGASAFPRQAGGIAGGVHRRQDLGIGQRLPLGLPGLGVDVRHARPHVLDVHRDQPDQVGAGVDRVGPVGARVQSQVLDRQQLDDGLVDLLLRVVDPVLERQAHPHGLGVLIGTHGDHEPRDGLLQAELHQVGHDLGTGLLHFVGVVLGRDRYHVLVAEQGFGGHRFVLADGGARLGPEHPGACAVGVRVVLGASRVHTLELPDGGFHRSADAGIEVRGTGRESLLGQL